MQIQANIRKLYTRLLSPESLTKIAYLNAFASILDYATRLVVGFIVNPFLVNILGDYFYGVWQILGRVIGYTSAVTGRPTQALKWTIASKQSSNDFSEKRRQISNSFAVWIIFLPILIVLGGVITWWSPAFLNATLENTLPIRLATGILVANLVIVGVADIPKSVLMGANLEYKRMGASTLLVIFGGGLVILALYLNTGIAGVALAQFAITILTGLFFLKVARENIPWFGWEIPVLQEIRDFLSLSGWFLAWRLVMQLLMSSDLVLLGVLITPEVVTVYTLSKYAPEIAISLIATVVAGILPGLGGMIGRNDFKRVAIVRDELLSIAWVFAVATGVTSLLWNHSFISLWVGEKYYAGNLVTLLIIVMVTQFVLIRSDANIIDLTLNLRSKVVLGVSSILISITISTILIVHYKMGIAGLCIGYILGRLLLSISYPAIISNYFKIPLIRQFILITRPIVVTAVLYAASLALNNLVWASNWIALAIFMAVTFGIALLFAFLAGLPKDIRVSITRRVARSLSINTI